MSEPTVGVLRDQHHHFMVRALQAKSAADRFMAQARRELHGAHRLAERIIELDEPTGALPAWLGARDTLEVLAAQSLVGTIEEHLVAEQAAIERCRALMQDLVEADPTTASLLQSLLAADERHAGALAGFLERLPG